MATRLLSDPLLPNYGAVATTSDDRIGTAFIEKKSQFQVFLICMQQQQKLENVRSSISKLWAKL